MHHQTNVINKVYCERNGGDLKTKITFILKQFSAGNKNGGDAIIIFQHSWENVKNLIKRKTLAELEPK